MRPGSVHMIPRIVKCFDNKCCSPYRSSYHHVIPSRFLPPPIPLIQVDGVLKVSEPNKVDATAKFMSLFVLNSLQWSLRVQGIY